MHRQAVKAANRHQSGAHSSVPQSGQVPGGAYWTHANRQALWKVCEQRVTSTAALGRAGSGWKQMAHSQPAAIQIGEDRARAALKGLCTGLAQQVQPCLRKPLQHLHSVQASKA